MFNLVQAKAWEKAIDKAQLYVDEEIPKYSYRWLIQNKDSFYASAIWYSGEHLVHIFVDLHGYYDVSVAKLDWLHSSADEECGCGRCM